MPNYGFAIDLRKCIGCHACTIACKAEHEIPIGVNRCWVKTVEKGTFPDTRRFFFPVLCNQCDDAPCARICPTNALFKRRDGIVDLHGDSCIGCRACMVACPYDQLFIDPNTHTAEKCNFCANRVENQLLPACVSVCPTECRIFGDLDDPTSEVAQIAQQRGDAGPQAGERHAPEGLLPRRRRQRHPAGGRDAPVHLQGRPGAAAPAGIAGAGSAPSRATPRVDYDTPHVKPWGLDMALYLLTKGIATGTMLVSLLLPFVSGDRAALTTVVGPGDLAGVPPGHHGAPRRRPGAARALLLHPHPPELAIVDGVGRLLPDRARAADDAVARRRDGRSAVASADGCCGRLVIVSLLTTCYTGFLFAQGLARDLWQGPQSTIDLLAQAVVEGCAVLLLAALVPGVTAARGVVPTLALTLVGAMAGAPGAHRRSRTS